MSTLVSEGNLLSVDVRAVLRPLQHSLTVPSAASGTGWCDDLDLRQPAGCSRAEGQNVRTGLCKMLWIQECVCVWVGVCACVCAKGKVDINNLCCIYFYLLMSPPCGPVFMLFLQINFAPLNNSACKWHEDLTELHELRNPQILQSDINCTQNVLINRSMVPIPCFCILMYTVCTNINI